MKLHIQGIDHPNGATHDRLIGPAMEIYQPLRGGETLIAFQDAKFQSFTISICEDLRDPRFHFLTVDRLSLKT